MTAFSDPASRPDPLADPLGRRRGLSSPALWLIVYGTVCLLIGVALGVVGGRAWPGKTAERPPARAVVAPSAAAPPAVQGAALPAGTPQAAALQAAAPQAAGAQAAAPSDARLAALQARVEATAAAAEAALASSLLAQAAETSRPFRAELDQADRLLPGSPDISALRSVAAAGAPSVATLAAEFPLASSRAAAAARGLNAKGAWSRLMGAFSGLVTLRRIDKLTGNSPDAVLARAERRVRDDDLAGALAELEMLPRPAQDALADWRVRAGRRLEIERRIAAIRQQALQRLVLLGRAA